MLPGILSRSALMTASVLIIVAMSAAFAWVLTVSRVRRQLTAWIVGMQPVADRVPARGQRAAAACSASSSSRCRAWWSWCPILAPIAHALGINDLQFGIIVIVNLTMGMITPPVGGLALRHLDRRARAAGPAGARAAAVARRAARGAAAPDARAGAVSTWLPGVLGYSKLNRHDRLFDDHRKSRPSPTDGRRLRRRRSGAATRRRCAHAQKTLKYAALPARQGRPAQARRRPGLQGARREGDQRIDQGRDLPAGQLGKEQQVMEGLRLGSHRDGGGS